MVKTTKEWKEPSNAKGRVAQWRKLHALYDMMVRNELGKGLDLQTKYSLDLMVTQIDQPHNVLANGRDNILGTVLHLTPVGTSQLFTLEEPDWIGGMDARQKSEKEWKIILADRKKNRIFIDYELPCAVRGGTFVEGYNC